MSTELLPREQRLDHRVFENLTPLSAKIRSTFTGYRDYLMSDPDIYTPQIRLYTESLARFLRDESLSLEAVTASNNAYFFAYMVGREVLGHEPSVYDASYIMRLPEKDPKVHLTNDAHRFLLDHPALHGLVDASLPFIDPSDQAHDIAYTVAGLSFRNIENSQLQAPVDTAFALIVEANS